MDEKYSYDYGSDDGAVYETLDNKVATLDSNFEIKEDKNATLNGEFEKKEEMEIVQLIRQNSSITQKELQKKTGISLGTIKRILPRLQAKGILVREGGKRFGKWIIKDNE